jgi:hypothetical protein
VVDDPEPLEPARALVPSRQPLVTLSVAVLLGVGAAWGISAMLSGPELKEFTPPAKDLPPFIKAAPVATAEAKPPTATPAPDKPQPPPVDGLLEQARDFIRKEDFNTARVVASDCAAKNPEAAQCHLLLGVIQAGFGNPQASAHHLEEFVRLAPEGDLDRNRLLKLLSDTNFYPPPEKLLALVKSPAATSTVVRGDQEWVKMFARRAQSLSHRYENTDRLGPARLCVALDPKQADCHLVLGDAYLRVFKRKESYEHYQLFLSLAAPSHPQRERVSKAVAVKRKAFSMPR